MTGFVEFFGIEKYYYFLGKDERNIFVNTKLVLINISK